MKKSQLKQLIKEELQSEITLKTSGGFATLERMLNLEVYESPAIEDFTPYLTLEDWMNMGNYDEDDDSPEAQEILDLAKTYFAWLTNGMIYTVTIEDGEGIDTQVFSKPFKRLITYGTGYRSVKIILAAF